METERQFTLEGTSLDNGANSKEFTKATDQADQKTEVEAKEEAKVDGNQEDSKVNNDVYEGVSKEEVLKFNNLTDDVSDDKVEEKTEDKKQEEVIEYKFETPANIPISEDVIKSLKDFSKEKKLSKEEAVKVFDQIVNAVKENQALAQKQFLERTKKWREESMNDPVLGKENLDKTISIVNKAIDKFGSNEFRKFLDLTGTGNNKIMLKFLYDIGKRVSEDSFVSGSGVPAAKQEVFNENAYGVRTLNFPSMNKK